MGTQREIAETIVAGGADYVQEWAGLARLAVVESHRPISGQTSIECRHGISSRACKTQEMAGVIWAHWGIENSLREVLDVS